MDQQQNYTHFIQQSQDIQAKSYSPLINIQPIKEYTNEIERDWNTLTEKLERSKMALEETLHVTKQYNEKLETVTKWTSEILEQINNLPVVGRQTEDIEKQKDQIQVN